MTGSHVCYSWVLLVTCRAWRSQTCTEEEGGGGEADEEDNNYNNKNNTSCPLSVSKAVKSSKLRLHPLSGPGRADRRKKSSAELFARSVSCRAGVAGLFAGGKGKKPEILGIWLTVDFQNKANVVKIKKSELYWTQRPFPVFYFCVSLVMFIVCWLTQSTSPECVRKNSVSGLLFVSSSPVASARTDAIR